MYITTWSGSSHGLWLWFIYFTDQSPSWEAKRFSASQEIPFILWNPKIHYRIHKCVLAQCSPYIISYFLKVNLSIILPSMPRSFKWSLSLRFHHQNPQYVSPLICYIHRLSFYLNLFNKRKWLLLIENIVILKFDYTDRVISLTVSVVCICTEQICFLAAF